MYDVSGGLFRLPKDRRVVPLPWFNRAPLGLETGTLVYAALVESDTDGGPAVAIGPVSAAADDPTLLYRPPDLVISVLEPDAAAEMRVLEVTAPDGPGRLHALLTQITQANEASDHVNVEIGESFTVPSPHAACRWVRQHRTAVYCRLLQQGSREVFEQMKHELVRLVGDRPGSQVAELAQPWPGRVTKNLSPAEVRRGRVTLGVDWRSEARDLFQQSLMADGGLTAGRAEECRDRFDYDLAFAVGDMGARSVRLMFPYFGARVLRSRHNDKPNTLVQVTGQIRDGHSILGGFLGKAGAGAAKMTAVCEPLPGRPPLAADPFPDATLRSANVGRVWTDAADDSDDVLYTPLPVDETVRQLGKKLDGLSAILAGLNIDLAPVLRLAKRLPRRPAVEGHRVCGVRMDQSIPARVEAAKALADLLPDDGIEMVDVSCDAADVVEAAGRPPKVAVAKNRLLPLLRLLASDMAVFVLWGGTDGLGLADPLILAFTHYLYRHERPIPALLLVEGRSGPLPPEAEILGVLFGTQVTVQPFTWTDRHAAAYAGYVRSGTAERPSLLRDPNCLHNRVLDWISPTDRSA